VIDHHRERRLRFKAAMRAALVASPIGQVSSSPPHGRRCHEVDGVADRGGGRFSPLGLGACMNPVLDDESK
jgi:hypothetical protein